MNKKFFVYLLTVVVALVALVGCEEDDKSMDRVILSETADTLFVGGTVTLEVASGASNNNIRWTTTNRSVATVNNGVVVAVALGSATINAITPDGRAGYCKIEVVKLVDTVLLEATDVSVILTEKVSLTAEVRPASASNQSLRWTSSDTTVAKVNGEGEVTGVGLGTAVVTVTTLDGGKSASCNVTVAWQPVESIEATASIKTLSTLIVGKTYPLTYTLLPKNANNKNVAWSSANPAVVSVSNKGVLTAHATGANIRITVNSEDVNTVRDYYYVTVVTAYPELMVGATEWAPTNATWDAENGRLFASRPDMLSSYYRWASDSAAVGPPPSDSLVAAHNYNFATNPCPIGWRLPHPTAMNALLQLGSTAVLANATREGGAVTVGNTVAGRFFGTRHASCTMADMTGCIFLPANGYLEPTANAITDFGSAGLYGSDVGSTYNPYAQNSMYFNTQTGATSQSYMTTTFKKGALNIRCIKGDY